MENRENSEDERNWYYVKWLHCPKKFISWISARDIDIL